MNIITLIFLMMVLLSCSTEPEPLGYGEDACHTCKMTLVDKKFGAELVTTEGKVYKFDDLNCMMTFYHSSPTGSQEFAHRLVVDFSEPEKLIPAADALYLKSPEIRSPMASQVAAFETKESMEIAQKDLKGIDLVWGELVTQFK